MSKLSQTQLILSYFKQNPNRDIPVAEVVDWAIAEWQKRTGSSMRPNTGALRTLHAKGQLVKVARGVYRYEPEPEIEDGVTLCEQHSKLNRVFGQTELGKRMIIGLRERAKAEDNEKVKAFTSDVLAVFEKHGVDSHVEWNDKP